LHPENKRKISTYALSSFRSDKKHTHAKADGTNIEGRLCIEVKMYSTKILLCYIIHIITVL